MTTRAVAVVAPSKRDPRRLTLSRHAPPAAMMIPHHQGAIDMAKVELIYGRDPVLRRLAQGIIVEQQQEIELMQRYLREGSCVGLKSASIIAQGIRISVSIQAKHQCCSERPRASCA